MKVTHTHRGHCQVCLRVQAIDVTTGVIAKHGYTVDGGYFSGECSGSGEKSLHVERVVTDRIIKNCDADAVRFTVRVGELKAGTVTPVEAESGKMIQVTKQRSAGHFRGPGIYTVTEAEMVQYADAPETYQLRALQSAIHYAERMAIDAAYHARTRREWAAKIFDAKVPAYRNEDLDTGDWKVGDTVRIGGKKGFDAVIEAIEDRSYTTHGYRQGRSTITIPHGRVTRPAVTEKRASAKVGGYVTREAKPAHTYWEALRNIKRPANKLAETLKKAGLL